MELNEEEKAEQERRAAANFLVEDASMSAVFSPPYKEKPGTWLKKQMSREPDKLRRVDELKAEHFQNQRLYK